jgi:hypothetical protein
MGKISWQGVIAIVKEESVFIIQKISKLKITLSIFILKEIRFKIVSIIFNLTGFTLKIMGRIFN